MSHIITKEMLSAFSAWLVREERSANTVAKYLHDVGEFRLWTGDKAVSRELVSQWKEELSRRGCSASTVNSYLAALHSFFAFLGWSDCRVKYYRLQRRAFRDTRRELSRAEFERLVQAAECRGDSRLALLLETVCATGIRVSELKYITLEAARLGRAEISLKGKIRCILIPGRLSRKLIKYAKKQKIASGELFITRSGKGISRRQIWGEMKRLCKAAGVDESKVFPHNLRHLFARAFYKLSHDLVRLADLLGHSSVETTRIYLISTGEECSRQLDKLGLVS